MLCEPLNIVDHYKHLAEVFGIGEDLFEYAGFDTTEAARVAAIEAAAALVAEIQRKKDERRESIDRTMMSVIELVSEMFDVKPGEIVESIIDTDTKTECLHQFFRAHGSEAIIFSYSPKLEGIERFGLLQDKDQFQTDQCIIIYRMNNTSEVTAKNFSNIANISVIKPNENWSLPLMLARIFREIWVPAFIQFGQAESTDTLMVLKACELFLENVDYITKNPTTLDIDEAFYAAHLSTPQQIQATAINRDLVTIVEEISSNWMRVIEKTLIQGQVIGRRVRTTGPIDEFDHWLQIYSMYSIAQELIATQKFKNHYECLEISGSKLVHKWKVIAHRLETANSEASEVVQFLNSLERFQFPLYGKIWDIKEHFDPLFVSLRTVYNTSQFYNTSNSMASFLSKCTNHLTVCCRNYILDSDVVNIFEQPLEQFLKKILLCLDVLRQYLRVYEENRKRMMAGGEPAWDFSEKYVFGQAQQLVDRLSKIQNIIETNMKYSILERILIEDIEKFSEPINKAYAEITKKSYDHLDFRKSEFDEDFANWQSTIERLEKEMYQFVAANIQQFPTRPLMALRHLTRFESLGFKCIGVQDRYIDIVNAFINNINELKDSFNYKKVSPVVANLMCTYSGRISWVRSIEMKLVEIISLLQRTDIFDDEKKLIVQRTVKFYNALSKDLNLYEFQQYKAWFDNVHFVFDLLSQPIIRRNPSTGRLNANFNIMILNTIEEGKKMCKLRLDVPCLGKALVEYEDDLRRKLQTISHLIEWNSEMRLSIPIVFLNICRPQLQKIDKAFKPGLSQIQWLSKDFHAYTDNVKKVLTDVESLVKQAADRKVFHIEDHILAMNELELLKRFDVPINIKDILDANEKHQKEIEQVLIMKSTMAEKAAVELVQLFISHTDGLPEDEKKDFIVFEKLFQQVFAYNEGDHIEPLFKDYDELQYGLEQLHSDCMDIFNYFILQILDGMIKNTKKTYELITYDFFLKNEAAVLSVAKLDPASCCYLSPNLDSMSETFLLLIKAIPDTFIGVNGWGALATVSGSTKYNLDEINLQQAFYKMMLGNKELQRTITKFDSGLSLLQPQIDSFLTDIYAKHCYLWASDTQHHIQEFVDTDPNPSAIEDEFTRYQHIFDQLKCAEKVSQINCIAIDLAEIYDHFIGCVIQSKKRLGELLAIIYKDKFDELNDFIENTEYVLRHKLKDDEDFMAAIECLLNVYQNSERMETNLYKTSGAYAILEKFNEPFGNVEKDQIDQLPVRYTKTFSNTKEVEVYIRTNLSEIMARQQENDMLIN